MPGTQGCAKLAVLSMCGTGWWGRWQPELAATR